jgi:hypothetical protein
VLCITGDWSQSGNVKSFGGGNKSNSPFNGCDGDNTALPGSRTAGAVPVDSHYFAFKAGSVKAIEASLSCGTWTFTCNTEIDTYVAGEVCLCTVHKELEIEIFSVACVYIIL